MGTVLSDETKEKMSVSKKALFQSEDGDRLRKIASKTAALSHSNNIFEKSKRSGHFPSGKNKKAIFYSSSYELRAVWLLENAPNVKLYETQIYYENDMGSRSLDLLVEFKDGVKLAVEIKPEKLLDLQENIDQIAASRANAENQGYKFEVWTGKIFRNDL